MQRIAVEDRRAALTAAAVRVVARDGVGRASTRAIAAEAGMPTASVHYAFASRAALLEAAVSALLADQRAGVAAAVDEAGTLRAFVAGALHGWLDRAIARPDAERALHELVSWSRSVPGLEALPDAVVAQYRLSVELFVHAATARFGVRWTVPEADVAAFALVVTDGVAARWLVDGDEAAARRALTIGADAVVALAAEARG